MYSYSSSSIIILKYFLILILFLFHHYTLGDIAILNPDNKSIQFLIDYKITYTPAIPDDGIIGSLTLADPIDACSELARPPHNHSNWFVLAYRSSSTLKNKCYNREKIQNAAKAGYKVIILYSHDIYQTSVSYSPFERNLFSADNQNIDFIFNYSALNTTIPGILISREDGRLLRNYLFTSGYKLYITPEITPNFSYYLIPFAILIGAGILIIISYLIFQFMMCIVERRKALRYRLSKKYLKKLTLQKYEKGIYYETCAICLDDYAEGEKIRILPCNHAYHMKCIDPWLTKNRRVCPVCKAKVTFPGMEEYSDSDSDNEQRRQSSATETTRLLGPNARNNNSHNSRNLRYLSLMIGNSSINNSTRNNQASNNTRYDLLDDSLIQPGPSTSAPVVSELSSNNNNTRNNNSRRARKKRNNRNTSNVHVVVADVSPLMAPSQLSINGDFEPERPNTGTLSLRRNSDHITRGSDIV